MRFCKPLAILWLSDGKCSDHIACFELSLLSKYTLAIPTEYDLGYHMKERNVKSKNTR